MFSNVNLPHMKGIEQFFFSRGNQPEMPEEAEKNESGVCPKCGHSARITAIHGLKVCESADCGITSI